MVCLFFVSFSPFQDAAASSGRVFFDLWLTRTFKSNLLELKTTTTFGYLVPAEKMKMDPKNYAEVLTVLTRFGQYHDSESFSSELGSKLDSKINSYV